MKRCDCDEPDGPCVACDDAHGHTCIICGEDFCSLCWERDGHNETCRRTVLRDGSISEVTQTPEEIERGLSEGCRYALAAAKGSGDYMRVDADAGCGHTNGALIRRGLLPPNYDAVFDYGSWWARLTPLGREVAALAKTSTRVGGGRGKRGPGRRRA